MSKSNPESPKKKPNAHLAGTTKPGDGTKPKQVRAVAAKKTLKPKSTSQTKTHPAEPIVHEVHAQNVETVQPETKDLSPQTTMEVHHHPQLEHKPKPWKEYLLEGFMIFIAVMMGFIAENIREDITNNEHVKQLTSRLVQDLKVDTAELAKQSKAETAVLKSNDSLFAMLQLPLAKVDTKKLQQLITNSHSMWPFHPSAVAIAAIKNQLYLKQFSDSEIISYIATYEKDIDLTRTTQEITLKYQRSFIDPFAIAHFTASNFYTALNQTGIPTTEMHNLTQDNLTQLGVSMVLIRINTHEVVVDNQQLKKDAIQLLHYVTKQYHLDE
jgi:hypothetical protein